LARGCVIGHLRTGSTGGPLIRCRSAARRRLRATVLRWPAALSMRGVGAVADGCAPVSAHEVAGLEVMQW